MEVQNISGSDVVVREFSSEYTQRIENAPREDRNEQARNERPVESGKGENFDRVV